MACFFYLVLTKISTTSGLISTGSTRKYQQIDVYIYQCECTLKLWRHVRQAHFDPKAVLSRSGLLIVLKK